MFQYILRKTSLAGPAIAMHLCVLLWSPGTHAQSPVQQFMANYVTAGSLISSYDAFPTNPGTFSSCSSNSYTYTWSNGTSNQLKLISFTANSKTYIIAGVSSVLVKLRRVNNANVTGTRNILYSETTTASATSCVIPRQLDFKAPYNDDMATFLNNNVLNHGTDNIFTNAGNGDGNNNNIERVDVVFTTGISSQYPADAGFILCERGNNNAHDGFRIAAILSMNGSNDPTSFGSVKTCIAGNGSNNGSWGHPSIANGNKLLAAYVLRKDPADTYLRVSSNVNQELGGIFFSLADLGVAANQIIYGYTLIGPDGTANPTSAQLLNTSDAAVFPTGTTEAQGGGLDLISVNTFFGTNQALASSFFTSFSGNVQHSDVLLNWTLNGVGTGTPVSLERSKDGISYSPVYSYIHSGNTSEIYRDIDPGIGTYYYRLKVQPASGYEILSSIVKLMITGSNQDWKVYPTIVRPGESIVVDNIADGHYSASFQNATSAMIYHVSFAVRNGTGKIQIPQKQMAFGIYCLVIENRGSHQSEARKIIIRNN